MGGQVGQVPSELPQVRVQDPREARTEVEVVASSGAKCNLKPVFPSLGPALGPEVLHLT